MSDVAVLFTVFKRLDTTQQVFWAIRDARPARLYIASDGPRQSVVGEAEAVAQVRQFILDHIDWPCQVQTLFRETNLGLRQAISGALDWFFTHEEAGIILEDDCVPHPSFFPFCAEMLDRYKDDLRVTAVSGNNFQQPTPYPERYSYYFSRYLHIWGWATWRRAWAHYDRDMELWPMIREQKLLTQILDHQDEVVFWDKLFQRTYTGNINTWDLITVYSFWLQGGLTITPQVNLVTNIGVGEQATHTDKHSLGGAYTKEIKFPLNHPPYIIRDRTADSYSRQYVFHIAPYYQLVWRYMKRILESVLRRLRAS